MHGLQQVTSKFNKFMQIAECSHEYAAARESRAPLICKSRQCPQGEEAAISKD